jgi:hypothetical protein
MPLVLLLLAVAVVCSLDDGERKKKRKPHVQLEKPTGVGGDSGGTNLGVEQHTASSGGTGESTAVAETSTIAGIKPADQIFPSKGK